MFDLNVARKMTISSFILFLVGNNFVQGKRQLPEYCVGKTNLHRNLKNNRKETSEILFTKKYLYDEK